MPSRKSITVPSRGAKPSIRGNNVDTRGASRRDILKLSGDLAVDFLRLQFTDITGINKNVEVPRSQFEKALDGEILFDGSSIEGFVRIEAEFFIFHSDEHGFATLETHDAGGYFDLAPVDRAEPIRRLIIHDLVDLGFEVEAGHHEVAEGQHEVDFKYADALTTADSLATFKFIVRNVAYRHGFAATFMPKPIFGQNGSGMHTHQSLFRKNKNAFYDPKKPFQLSDIAMGYIAGLLNHARGFCAITNPLVNSYKRLVPGYEAPVNVAWSMRNRSPLVRIPERRRQGTRCELRMPDPSANPYLALTVQLAAGLDGVEQSLTPPDPVNKNIFTMSYRERRRYRIDELPRDLHEALDHLEKDKVVREALGSHIYQMFLEAKREEWRQYSAQVSAWEIERYLGRH